MGGKAVPDHEQLPTEMALEVRLFPGTITGPQVVEFLTEVEAPPRDPGDRRQEIPAAVVLEDGRLAARGPRPVAVRALGQSAFVDEHDRLPLRGSIF
jgi:hypothetical protein